MTSPLVKNLEFNGMMEYVDSLLLETAAGGESGNPPIMDFLRHLKSINGYLPNITTPIYMETYIKEVDHHREATSMVP